jgi:toxin YoeB
LVGGEWRVVFAKAAQKDARNVAAAGLKQKLNELLAILREDPYRSPRPFEKRVGDLAGFYSRRIPAASSRLQNRFCYADGAGSPDVDALRLNKWPRIR